MGVAFPEAFVVGLAETEDGDIAPVEVGKALPLVGEADTVVIGPGVSRQRTADAIVRSIVHEAPATASLLFDARAIGSVRTVRDAISSHAGRIVLTPHGGEMAALMGRERDELEADPVRCASEAAVSYGAVVAFKGPNTFIAAEGREPCVAEGHVGLATSGSGNVLAGVIAGLLARGAEPFQATCGGVYIYAEAGRRLAQDMGKLGFLARELLPQIPRAMTGP